MIGAPAKATPKTAVQREALSFAGSCLALNAAMVVLKTVVGVFAGSHALLASAMYSVNDVLTSIAVLLSLEIGNRKPDRSHPYGYTKAEYIAAGMVSLVIAVGVFFMFFFSVLDILRGVPGPPHFIAMSLAAVSMIASWAIARRGHKLSHKLRSPVLATHSKHHHADAEGSLLAIIGVAGALMGFHTFDRIIAVMETLHLIALSGALLARSVKGLMDTSMASEDIDLVRHACLEVEGVHDIAHIRSRQAGRDTWVDVAVAVGSKLDVLEAGRICNNVGSAVRGVLGSNVVAQVRFQGPSFVYESPGPGGSPHG